MLVALFGITNEGVNLFVNLLLLFLVVVWVALIAWTYLDARRRIQDPVLIACATGASLFPYVGTVVYMILRPPEYLEDARERELEIRAAQLRVRQLEEQSCANCGHPIEQTYLRCPGCRARVKDPCESCSKPIDPRWAICPYCETPQRRAAPQPRRATEPSRRASAREGVDKRGRAKRSPRSEGTRQPATATRSGKSRQSRAKAPRPDATASKQKGTAGRPSSTAEPTREAPGDDRPRPATAS
jgi:hypothetical protein